MSKYLDSTGLGYLWGKIKALIPTKTSDLTNDSGYLTSYTETDPTVPAWAKASSKPIYTASEVGAVPTTRTVNGKALSSDITLNTSDVGIKKISVTLLTGNWNSTTYQQTVTASGVTASNTVIVSPMTGVTQRYAEAGIRCLQQTTDALTFVCDSIPSDNFAVNVLIL